MPAGSDTPATPTARGQFPARTAAETPVSRRERVVAFAVVLACVLPPWLTGAWDEWAQWTTLGLALAAFATLFAPMFDYRAWPPSLPARASWWRLRRFPIFWLGLAALVYGAVAALNPWKVLYVGHDEFGLRNLSHLAWLPHGVEAPFTPMNVWRALLVIAPAWLVACAVWVGLEGARPLRWLLGAVGLNGALLAALGIAQQLDGAKKMFWSYDSRAEYPDSDFFASFVYSGHAAAWLALATGAVVVLLDAHLRPLRKWIETGEQPEKSDLAAWQWIAALTVLIVAFSQFVKPDFWGLSFGVVMGIWVWVWAARCVRAGRRHLAVGLGALGVVFALLILVSAGLGVATWRQSVVSEEDLAINPGNPSLPVRYAVAQTSARMIPESPLFGWGPGSYRYAARDYLLNNSIFLHPERRGSLRYRPDYAYNDWVQIAVEWGWAGLGLIAGGIYWWLAQIWKVRRTLPGEAWCGLGAVACVFAGSMFDFPLQNPAVLICLGVLMLVMVKLGEAAPPARPAGEIFHGA